MTVTEQIIDLIDCALSGRKPDADAYSLTEEEQQRLYGLSCAHDLAHLVGNELIRNNLLPKGPCRKAFDKQGVLAVFRCENMKRQCKNIRTVLNAAGIAHVFLKGAALRRYYPEEWMRTSCDIDVLVREGEAERAAGLLIEKCGYTAEKKGFHDISLHSPEGVHLELHFSLLEDVAGMDTVLAHAWDYVRKEQETETTFTYCFTPEFFLFHVVAHAAYHFLGGGCGVRTVLDIFLLQRKMPYDAAAFRALTEEAGLSRFAEEIFALGRMWFANGERTELLSAMEYYIFDGGVYGSYENRSAIGQAKKKGKIGFLFSRIWMPYEKLKRRYPRLEGRKHLLLLYEIRRWFTLLFDPAVRRRSVAECRTTAGMKREKCEGAAVLLDALALRQANTGEKKHEG